MTKTKNTLWIITGIINVITLFIHLIAGQTDLIDPFLKSDINSQIKTELLGVWHMVTIILLGSSIIYLKYGINNKKHFELIYFISFLYIAFSLAFILSSAFSSVFAPQWILLLPIGVLGIIGIKKSRRNA
ncbi:hypothetical protein [Flavivirga eckloniae]|uniref:DUF423 domain-containing protein n=1 Tax=Flavivirga eckloniae TaxID=1803846 RepID=A0A2K9PL23_9FLAO|nr:hypothetical protein [Flavivirga eckloniae]AUP77725.1 hypothetical protein C1H87_02945 [Flavivirga eckloniae]